MEQPSPRDSATPANPITTASSTFSRGGGLPLHVNSMPPVCRLAACSRVNSEKILSHPFSFFHLVRPSVPCLFLLHANNAQRTHTRSQAPLADDAWVLQPAQAAEQIRSAAKAAAEWGRDMATPHAEDVSQNDQVFSETNENSEQHLDAR